jgi:hypothetical protein
MSTTYYIRTDGSDSNSGQINSSGGAWATFGHATASVNNGDTIHLVAGTYNISSQIVLPAGVNLIGDGDTSVINSNYQGSTTSGVLTLTTGVGNPINGNQSVSYIKLNGNNQYGYCGISSSYRYGVSIHHCTVINFRNRGISIHNGTDFMDAPSYYSTGNSVYNCVINDCGYNDANFSEYAGVWWYGQNDFLFYNNTLTFTAYTSNADSFKCAWHVRSKIYNNIFYRPTGDNGGQWNFFTELFFTRGACEIYSNIFNGNATFDVVDVRAGSESYGMKIYGNTWALTSQVADNSHGIQAIDFEDWGAIQDVYVYDNHFKNTSTAIQFDAKGQSNPLNIGGLVRYERLYINYNIFENIGVTDNTWKSAIDIKPQGTDSLVLFDSVYVDNNVIISNNRGASGVLFETCTNLTNIYVRNNIIKGFVDYPIGFSRGTSGPTLNSNSIYVQNNLYYQNSADAIGYSLVSVPNIHSSNNAVGNPFFVSTSDFHLTSNSTLAIDHGIHISVPVLPLDYDGILVGNPPEIGVYEYGISQPVIPTLTTTNVTNITSTSASSGGVIYSDGGAAISTVGVCWSTSINPTTANSKTQDTLGSGSFVSSITGLSSSTTYHVRAYAVNSVGIAYGNDILFVTSTPVILATVTTQVVTNISYSSATLHGNLTNNGGDSNCLKTLIYSSHTTTPTLSNYDGGGGTQTGIGSFVIMPSSLSPATLYYVRSVATNSAGTSYGNIVTFTTLPFTIPTLTTTAATNITKTVAWAGGTVIDSGGGSISQEGVCYDTSPLLPTSNTVYPVASGLNSPFTCQLTSLTPNTTYYIRAYAFNSVGGGYGNILSFTTLPTKPTLTLTSISNITDTTATVAITVVTDGGGAITSKGVCWSLTTNPNIYDSITSDGSGNSSFLSSLSGLVENTTYHVRGYATNSDGTAYTDDVQFTTLSSNPWLCVVAAQIKKWFTH